MAEQNASVNEQMQHDHHTHDHTCNHSHGETTDCGIPSYTVRNLIVRDDILKKTNELAEAIFRSEEVQHYRRAEQQIQGHDRVQSLIAQIKKKQKEVVAFETTFKNADMVKKIEAEMAALQDELDGIPIITEFQQSQSDINYLLQMVVSAIRDTVAEKINVEDASEPDPEDCSD